MATQTLPLSRTLRHIVTVQQARIESAQRELERTYAIIAAHHDIAECSVVSVTDTGLVVRIPERARARKRT